MAFVAADRTELEPHATVRRLVNAGVRSVVLMGGPDGREARVVGQKAGARGHIFSLPDLDALRRFARGYHEPFVEARVVAVDSDPARLASIAETLAPVGLAVEPCLEPCAPACGHAAFASATPRAPGGCLATGDFRPSEENREEIRTERNLFLHVARIGSGTVQGRIRMTLKLKTYESAAQRCAVALAPRLSADDFKFVRDPRRWPTQGVKLQGFFPTDQYNDYGRSLGSKLVRALSAQFPDLEQDPNALSSGEVARGSRSGTLAVRSKTNPSHCALVGVRRSDKGGGFEVTGVTPRIRINGEQGKTTEATLVNDRLVSFQRRFDPGAQDVFTVSGHYLLVNGQPGPVHDFSASRFQQMDRPPADRGESLHRYQFCYPFEYERLAAAYPGAARDGKPLP